MINLSLNKLKLIAKSRNIKYYENKSEDDLIKVVSVPKQKISLSKKKIRKIKEKFNELRERFSRPKIKEIRRNIYDMKMPPKYFRIKNKKISLN